MLPYFSLVEASSPPCACVLSTCPSLCLTSLCLCSLHLPLPLPHLPVLVFSPLAPPSASPPCACVLSTCPSLCLTSLCLCSLHLPLPLSLAVNLNTHKFYIVFMCVVQRKVLIVTTHTHGHTLHCVHLFVLWVDGRLFKNIFFIHVLCLHSSISCLPVFFR